MISTRQERLQETQYEEFPYHYLPIFANDEIRLTRYWGWCIQYLGRLYLITNHLKDTQYQMLLDIGCGDGRLINLLSNNVAGDVVLKGIDYSSRTIQLAKALNIKANVTFDVVDVFNDDVDGLFDIVTFVEVLEHIRPKRLNEFIEKSLNFLKQEGYVLITVPSMNLSLREKHYQHFSADTLCSVLETAGLTIIETKYIDSRSWMMQQFYRLLYNRLFILNNPLLIRKIFDFYVKNNLYADKNTGEGIFVLCQKC